MFTVAGQILELVTGQAVTVDYIVSYADKTTAGVESFGNERGTVNAAATTTILTAPAASTYRKVKEITIVNRHATTAVDVTIQLDVSATNYEFIPKVTLQAKQTLFYSEITGPIVFEPLSTYAKSRQILTASGTYTTPAGVRAIFIECVGGGGGGGGCANAATNSAAAGGGGGGAYSTTLVQNPNATYSITIGAAGTAGASGNNAGGTGGDTIFGSVCTAKGGSGGAGDTVATIHVGGLGGAGGVIASGVGDYKSDGISGGTGMAFAAAQCISGPGGSTVYSAGAIEKRNATGAGGTPLTTNGGGGGSGASIISGGASQAGGAGAAGLIIVTEYGN